MISSALARTVHNRSFHKVLSNSAQRALAAASSVPKEPRGQAQSVEGLRAPYLQATKLPNITMPERREQKVEKSLVAEVPVPQSAQEVKETIGQMRTLLLSNSFNTMTQRAFLELQETYGQDVRVELARDEAQILDCIERHQPDVIICPFLTKRIPQEVWQNKDVPCLIIHPGIHGDRGASSIDWALKEGASEWGVTVLQADEEMDAGDIWATQNFPVPPTATKSTLYGKAAVNAAMACMHEALEKIANKKEGIPLDYSDPSVKGTLRDNMKLADRKIDFNQSSEMVVNTIRFSDSSPGTPWEVAGEKVFIYGAHADNDPAAPTAKPGTITGKCNGAVRVACGSGSIWITHMKGRGKQSALPKIKLPATDILPNEVVEALEDVAEPNIFEKLTEGPFRDIWVTVSDTGVATMHFPFLNGAMSTTQCHRLIDAFEKTCDRADVKVVVLAGGASAWSNGINLNTIEASDDPQLESWQNINAINDFVKAIFSRKDVVTIAALQGNAGAGGVMAALACDQVWADETVVLNPHYKTMGLHGSEYWTHFLPNRVGDEMAAVLTQSCLPLSATRAHAIGLVDAVFQEDGRDFMSQVAQNSERFAEADKYQAITEGKRATRDEAYFKALQNVRDNELKVMRENFKSAEYDKARSAFVNKTPGTMTPLHLLTHNRLSAPNNDLGRATLLDGAAVAKNRNDKLAEKVAKRKERFGASPRLAVLLVNGREDSERYVRQKTKTAKKVGIDAETIRFDFNDSAQALEAELIRKIRALNDNKVVNGIMVQLPLPAGIDQHKVLSHISAEKDVDGFHAMNIGALAGGATDSAHTFEPCTPKGVMALLDHYGVPLTGKNVCIIGQSNVVGKPLQLSLMGRGATVTGCNINTHNIAEHVKRADVVVAAAGVPELIQPDWVKPGAVVVDVGFHVQKTESDVAASKTTEKIVGDVDEAVGHVAALVTPVPGGVGPMTVSMLLENTVDAFDQQHAMPSENHL